MAVHGYYEDCYSDDGGRSLHWKVCTLLAEYTSS